MRDFQILLAGLCALSLLGASTAYAEDETPPAEEEVLAKAQTLLNEANAFYAAKEYEQARASYQAAYELTQAPGFLYNIAQSHRLAGQCRLAIEHYEKFLSLDPKSSLRPKVEGFVQQMWTCLEREKKKEEQAKSEQDKTAAPKEVDGAPSNDDKEPAAQSFAATDGSGPGAPSRLPLVGLAVAGGGVLALGTSLYFGLQARSKSSEIEQHMGEWGPAQQATQDDAQSYENLAVVLGIAGGAALAGGIATYILFGGEDTRGIALLPSEDGLMFTFSLEH